MSKFWELWRSGEKKLLERKIHKLRLIIGRYLNSK